MTTYTPRTRKTIALTGTTARTDARLDHASELALGWAALWITHAAGARPAVSAVLRRALTVYADYLQAPTTNPAHEATEVRHASRGWNSSLERQHDADTRLAAIVPGEPVPPLQDIISGPGWRESLAELDARVDASVARMGRRWAGKLQEAAK